MGLTTLGLTTEYYIPRFASIIMYLWAAHRPCDGLISEQDARNAPSKHNLQLSALIELLEKGFE